MAIGPVVRAPAAIAAQAATGRVAAFVGVEEAVAAQVPTKRDRRDQHEQRQAEKRARWRGQ